MLQGVMAEDQGFVETARRTGLLRAAKAGSSAGGPWENLAPERSWQAGPRGEGDVSYAHLLTCQR